MHAPRGDARAGGGGVVLEAHLRDNGAVAEALIEVLEVQVRHSDDPFQQVEAVQERVAKLYEDMLEIPPYSRPGRGRSCSSEQRDCSASTSGCSRCIQAQTWPRSMTSSSTRSSTIRFASRKSSGFGWRRIYEGGEAGHRQCNQALRARGRGRGGEHHREIEALDPETGRYQEPQTSSRGTGGGARGQPSVPLPARQGPAWAPSRTSTPPSRRWGRSSVTCPSTRARCAPWRTLLPERRAAAK